MTKQKPGHLQPVVN